MYSLSKRQSRETTQLKVSKNISLQKRFHCIFLEIPLQRFRLKQQMQLQRLLFYSTVFQLKSLLLLFSRFISKESVTRYETSIEIVQSYLNKIHLVLQIRFKLPQVYNIKQLKESNTKLKEDNVRNSLRRQSPAVSSFHF